GEVRAPGARRAAAGGAGQPGAEGAGPELGRDLLREHPEELAQGGRLHTGGAPHGHPQASRGRRGRLASQVGRAQRHLQERGQPPARDGAPGPRQRRAGAGREGAAGAERQARPERGRRRPGPPGQGGQRAAGGHAAKPAGAQALGVRDQGDAGQDPTDPGHHGPDEGPPGVPAGADAEHVQLRGLALAACADGAHPGPRVHEARGAPVDAAAEPRVSHPQRGRGAAGAEGVAAPRGAALRGPAGQDRGPADRHALPGGLDGARRQGRAEHRDLCAVHAAERQGDVGGPGAPRQRGGRRADECAVLTGRAVVEGGAFLRRWESASRAPGAFFRSRRRWGL
ncbi:unnamed protein product, partial [Prorocentrum cordatum]